MKPSRFLFLFFSLSLSSCGLPKSGDTLFADDFSKSDSGWNQQADADATTGYVDGEYRIAILTPNLNVWSASGPQLADVIVETDARTAAGPDNNLFGLICRYQDDKNFYFLAISADSYYVIGKLEEGRIVYLSSSSFEYSDKILPGSAAHRLTGTCIGNALTLSVNGALLSEATDNDFKKGLVGLLAGAFDQPDVDVRFDNLVVVKP